MPIYAKLIPGDFHHTSTLVIRRNLLKRPRGCECCPSTPTKRGRFQDEDSIRPSLAGTWNTNDVQDPKQTKEISTANLEGSSDSSENILYDQPLADEDYTRDKMAPQSNPFPPIKTSGYVPMNDAKNTARRENHQDLHRQNVNKYFNRDLKGYAVPSPAGPPYAAARPVPEPTAAPAIHPAIVPAMDYAAAPVSCTAVCPECPDYKTTDYTPWNTTECPTPWICWDSHYGLQNSNIKTFQEPRQPTASQWSSHHNLAADYGSAPQRPYVVHPPRRAEPSSLNSRDAVELQSPRPCQPRADRDWASHHCLPRQRRSSSPVTPWDSHYNLLKKSKPSMLESCPARAAQRPPAAATPASSGRRAREEQAPQERPRDFDPSLSQEEPQPSNRRESKAQSVDHRPRSRTDSTPHSDHARPRRPSAGEHSELPGARDFDPSLSQEEPQPSNRRESKAQSVDNRPRTRTDSTPHSDHARPRRPSAGEHTRDFDPSLSQEESQPSNRRESKLQSDDRRQTVGTCWGHIYNPHGRDKTKHYIPSRRSCWHTSSKSGKESARKQKDYCCDPPRPKRRCWHVMSKRPEKHERTSSKYCCEPVTTEDSTASQLNSKEKLHSSEGCCMSPSSASASSSASFDE